jgi:16S rRNA (uracil1498-N3)-methyltransferase
MASLYFDESIAAEAFSVGALIEITGEDARHATQVARVRIGERIAIGDGRGRIARGPVVETAAGRLVLKIGEVDVETARVPGIRLVQALAKGDRDELAVQAATELGVSAVIPWSAARSVSRWEGAKAQRGRARWATIAREASKQSIRATVPDVGEIVTTAQLARFDPLVLVLDPAAAEPLSTTDIAGVESITLVVGPEGGIDARELEQLEAAGARRVRLGAEVLRTSTAGPAAIAALSIRLQRW